MSDTSASTSTRNRKLPKAGSVGKQPEIGEETSPGIRYTPSCKYCGETASSARIDADGSRINVCAAHNPMCGLCRHFVAGDGPMGECHLRAPVVVVANDAVVTAYPDVEADKVGCWEGFKPR